MSYAHPEGRTNGQGEGAARIFLAQASVIGAAASLGLFLTTGVSPRSVGFAVFACAAAAALLLTCWGRRQMHPPASRPRTGEAAGAAQAE
jgi:hypothetical protein